MVSTRSILAILAVAGNALALSPYSSLQVRPGGVPVGQFRNVSGISVYHSYPPGSNASTKAILFMSDALGVLQTPNQLLADSYASNGYLVLMPDFFEGDAVDEAAFAAGTFDLEAWLARHPPERTTEIMNLTLDYMRNDFGVERIGGAGFCWGGKYMPHFLTEDGPIDVGFIAHPTNLTEPELQAVAKPLSIAAGTLDATFNSTDQSRAERILDANKVAHQSNVYYGAQHGFGTRANMSVPAEVYARQAAFVQAVTWFDAWL